MSKSYRRQRREAIEREMPLGDQLDAWLKDAKARRDRGETLVAELDALVDKSVEIKERFPKPAGAKGRRE